MRATRLTAAGGTHSSTHRNPTVNHPTDDRQFHLASLLGLPCDAAASCDSPSIADTADALKASKAMATAWTPERKQAFLDELHALEGAFANAMREGSPGHGDRVQFLVRRHHEWVGTAWAEPVSIDAYLALADLYEHHPDFVHRYESIATGLTDYLTYAMRIYAARASYPFPARSAR